MINLNTGFYKDLDTNFEQAYSMALQEFSHDDLIQMLKFGNIPEKQIAALKLDTLLSEEEVQVFLSNLTGCDGKIREATALKINKLITEQTSLIPMLSVQPERYAMASVDINGNICRLIIDSVLIFKSNKDFSRVYISTILKFIDEAFCELDKFIFRDKKYVINKQLFKLYWCLEALKIFVKDIEPVKLYNILYRASQEKEYTIREKVAQILQKTNSSEFDDLKLNLKDDENYYVRQVFLNHPSIFN